VRLDLVTAAAPSGWFHAGESAAAHRPARLGLKDGGARRGVGHGAAARCSSGARAHARGARGHDFYRAQARRLAWHARQEAAAAMAMALLGRWA
jgi:hypothetical protein